MMAMLSAHLSGQSRRRAWRTDVPSRSQLLAAEQAYPFPTQCDGMWGSLPRSAPQVHPGLHSRWGTGTHPLHPEAM